MIKFLFLFFSSFVFAQGVLKADIRVQYNLKSKNKLNSDHLRDENFMAIIGENKSLFKPVNNYVYDSLVEKGASMDKAFEFFDLDSQVNILVSKEEIVFTDLLGYNDFGYKEKNDFNDWKILNEFKEVSGKKCQKAIIHKYNKDWIAYFSTDYPFPFGPYKFNGLPGLILELYDIADNFHYTLKSIKKYPKAYPYARIGKSIFLDKDKYYKVRSDMITDVTNGGRFKFDPESTRKMMNTKKEILANENLIEK